MAAPTPETLEVFQMIRRNMNQDAILRYINENSARIDVNYVDRPDPELDKVAMIEYAAEKYKKVMKKLLDLGARVVDDEVNGVNIVESLMDYFDFPQSVTDAKDLMNALINAGFPKEKMLHLIAYKVNETHKELLKTLLDLPLNINYKFAGQPVLLTLLASFKSRNSREILIDMIQLLIEKGANPNEVDDFSHMSVIQHVNEYFSSRNSGPILDILQGRQGALEPNAAAPIDYKKLWEDELRKALPDIKKLEEYKTHGEIDVNAQIRKNGRIEYPLSISLQRKPNLKLIETLLKWGANPNILYGDYPIYFIAFDRSIDDLKPLLSLLIAHGADMKIKSIDYNCIMKFIYTDKFLKSKFTQKHKDILDILIANGADLTYRNDRGYDVVDICILNNKYDVMEYFISKGAPLLVNGKTRFYKYILDALNLLIPDDYVYDTIKGLKSYLHGNDLCRDFLDAALTNPSNKMLNTIFQHIFIVDSDIKLFPNFNMIYEDGSTPLIKAVQIYDKSRQQWSQQMIEYFLDKSANPSYVDTTGKKAADYTSDEEIKELLGESHFKIVWTGFSKADIDFTNMLFGQIIHPTNLATPFPNESLYSICPVCLKHIQHENTTCMYMTHSCVEQAGYNGYYHKKLFKTFGYKKKYYANGAEIPPHLQKFVIEWCTHCGRICKKHRHYKLIPLFNEDGSIRIPEFAGDGDYYATTCAKPNIGGGGIEEKINRYRRFREVVLALNSPDAIGKIPYEEAINTLVEAVWEAPLDPRRFEISMIKRTKQFNSQVANIRFPLPSELPPPPKYIYSDPSYPDAANPDLFPIVQAKATNIFKNSAYNTFGDDENIVQFRHRMSNGSINTHAGSNQKIALGRLMTYIQHMNESVLSADFGMCWQHNRESYEVLLNDPTSKPPKCTARLYPDEILYAIEHATLDNRIKQQYMSVYNYYKKLFAEKYGKPIGLAPNSIPNRKNENNQNGGVKTRQTRKRNHRHRKTSLSKMRG